MLDPHIWPQTATLNAAGHLDIGGCDTVALAQGYGTPLYLLDEATIRAACRSYRSALASHYPGPTAVHYAGKALLNTAVAQLVASEGLGLDVVSGGELFVALRAGVPPAHIHLHGNAKTRAELEAALAAAIGNIMVDNLDELALLAELSGGRVPPQPIMLRLTPDIATSTHAHIQTGHATSKFGLPLAQLDAAARLALAAPGLRLHGLHAHLGSQLFDPAVFAQALVVLLDCAARLRDEFGLVVEELSPGGGLGVPYTAAQAAPDLDGYAALLAQTLAEGCATRRLPLPRLVIEPGRSIVARAGVGLYTVIGRKQLAMSDVGRHETSGQGDQETSRPADKRQEPGEMVVSDLGSQVSGLGSLTGYLHVDGGMGDNIRPALYQASYTALLANRAAAAPQQPVDVAGRYCESGDVLLHGVMLPHAQPGDLLALASAGAYTLSMASNYNLVPRPALLLLDQGKIRVIQRRETYDDLVARDGYLS